MTESDKAEVEEKETEKESKVGLQWLFTLCLPLWLAYVSNQWSRSSIYYLVDFSDQATPFKSMNIELSFSQGQYGLLASVAFTSLFAVASLVAGLASDRFNRKTLTSASAAAWGVATLATGLSNSYSQVVFARIAMGLACAFSTPTAYTLLAENVPKQRGALAASLYSTGVALGGALASLSILLDTQVGWRNTLFAISVFAFAAAAVNALLLPDDRKAQEEEEQKQETKMDDTDNSTSIISELSQIISTSRTRWLFLGSFLRFSSGLSIGVWSAPFFRGLFPSNAADYAVAQALITALCGVTSGLVGGALADRIAAANSNNVATKLWIPVVGSLLAIPAWYLAIHQADSFPAAMAFLAAEFLVAECWFGPTVNVLQSTVGPRVGGTAQGLFTVTGALANLAPTALGFLYDAGNYGDLTRLLTIGVCGGYLLSSLCFAASAMSPEPPPAAMGAAKQEKAA